MGWAKYAEDNRELRENRLYVSSMQKMTLKQLRKLLEQLDAEEKVAVIPGYKTYYGCW